MCNVNVICTNITFLRIPHTIPKMHLFFHSSLEALYHFFTDFYMVHLKVFSNCFTISEKVFLKSVRYLPTEHSPDLKRGMLKLWGWKARMYKISFCWSCNIVVGWVCMKIDSNRDKPIRQNFNNRSILEDIWISVTLLWFFSIQYFKVFTIKIWRDIEAWQMTSNFKWQFNENLGNESSVSGRYMH